MSWWRRLLGQNTTTSSKPSRVDYMAEALALEKQDDFDGAVTSYRLALRDRPNDPRILQNMAIAYSRLGRLDDAVRSYNRALTFDPGLSGAHYGLAFLLLKRGDDDGAKQHLTAFLQHPPAGDESERWIAHARQTLASLTSQPDAGAAHSERD
jgi:Flp pilus assembly protein TadD